MKKTDKPPKGKKQRAPAKPKRVTELTEHDLKQVQGGQGLSIPEVQKFK